VTESYADLAKHLSRALQGFTGLYRVYLRLSRNSPASRGLRGFVQSFPRVLLELTKCFNQGIEKLVGTFLGGSDQSSVFTLVHGLRNVVQCIPEYVQFLATTFDHKAVQSGPGNFHGQVKLEGMAAKSSI
jgi:hypothetical protein